MRHLRVERGLSENTLLTYGYQLKNYLAFLVSAKKNPLSVNRNDIIAYLEAKKNSGRRSSTLFTCAIALRQFHKFLKDRGHIDTNPIEEMRLPKFKQRLPEPLGVEEMEKLLNLPTGSKFHHVCTKAALELLYSTGMRVSELVKLRLEQVNFEEGWIRVMGKGGKERLVPLGLKAREALVFYMKAREAQFSLSQDTLFLNSRGHGLTRSVFWRQLQAISMRVKIRERLHPHRIRHSAASHMLAGGADIRIIQELLGHKSILTTQRYTHVSPELLKFTCRKTHPHF